MIGSISAAAIVAWFRDAQHWHGTNGVPHRLVEHLWLCGLSLVVAVVLALPIAIVLGHLRRGGTLAQNVANIGRAVPSLAILIIAVPIVGIGSRPAELALIALAIPPLLTNTYVGMSGVDDDVRDAARGVGMTAWQTTTRVELPLALPLILAGLRTAAFQVVATATLAAVVASGGLGRYIVDGLAIHDDTQVVCGSLLVLALALLVELTIAGLQRALVPAPLRDANRPRPDKQLEESPEAIQLEPAA
ncbi:MAG: ABC transporter permease subunit [Acidimicrobiales bacterium]